MAIRATTRALVWSLAMLGGCHSLAATQISLEVDSDYAIGTELDQVQIVIARDMGAVDDSGLSTDAQALSEDASRPSHDGSADGALPSDAGHASPEASVPHVDAAPPVAIDAGPPPSCDPATNRCRAISERFSQAGHDLLAVQQCNVCLRVGDQLPTLAVVPVADESLDTWRFFAVTGLLRGASRVSATQATHFVPYADVPIRVVLERACEMVTCPADTTCSHGVCIPIEVPPMCLLDGGDSGGMCVFDASLPDAGPPPLDAHIPDARVAPPDAHVAPPDAGVDASPSMPMCECSGSAVHDGGCRTTVCSCAGTPCPGAHVHRYQRCDGCHWYDASWCDSGC